MQQVAVICQSKNITYNRSMACRDTVYKQTVTVCDINVHNHIRGLYYYISIQYTFRIMELLAQFQIDFLFIFLQQHRKNSEMQFKEFETL